MEISKHVSVLLKEVVEYLDLKPNDNVVDGTVGGGGHAEEMLKRIAPEGKLLGIDADAEALERTRLRLARFGARAILVKGNFRNLKTIVHAHFPLPVRAILLDLGISSDQLDDADRGFSFLTDGPLDMRLGGKGDATTPSASAVVNTLPEADLARIIRMWGEERYARSISHSIVISRKETPFETTHQLVSAILHALPPHARRVQRNRLAIHPATRTFQALRISVNQELDSLKEVIPQAVDVLEPGGRLVVISFHSLEDRIVKQECVKYARKGMVKIMTRKPVGAGAREVQENPRARSAKMRVIEKL